MIEYKEEITRAEFMALVNRSFGLNDKSEEYEQVAIALHAGYVSGLHDGMMRTGNKVTRQEAIRKLQLNEL